ncbi:PEP-CTERM sorting domain-containing protein [Rubritalea sp.]|uniref:PEP-CTERM sorting domain-containing protein n=1 Tax=Rubritalea sp. TaxID=2109375 RepID=UPI003EFB2A97
MKTLYTTLSAGLFLTGIAQAALTLDSITNNSGIDDSTGVDFSGQSVTSSIDNWGRNDVFTNADLTSTTITLSGNQAFLGTTITNTDFTGATFNITTWLSGSLQRFNTFRNATGSGASFVDTAWNITLSSADAFNNSEFFDGTGTFSNMDFSGAAFSFDITSSDAATQTAAVGVIVANLGDTGASYDTAFLTNNFAAFGYGDEAALGSALTSAGWQAAAVPEPSSVALLGLGGLSLMLRRRR